MNINCLLCGVGGQGTVLASRLITFAAMEKGQNVRTAETIGMAQRGGCVVSHARIGETIYSPLIPKGKADIIIGFEPAEAVRCLDYLKPGGTVIVNTHAVKPVTASLSSSSYTGAEMLAYLRKNAGRTVAIDGDAICAACGSPKVLNIALLAAACHSGMLGITVEELRHAICCRIPEKFHALNLKAIALACVTGTAEGEVAP